jgi:hypothetical protein
VTDHVHEFQSVRGWVLKKCDCGQLAPLTPGQRRMIDNPRPGQLVMAERILDEMGF